MSTLKIKRENGKIFCPLADSWHIETPEEKVRQEYIKILVENYGFAFAPSSFLLYCVPADQYFRSKILL